MSLIPVAGLCLLGLLVALLLRVETRRPRDLGWVRVLKPAATITCLAIALSAVVWAPEDRGGSGYGVLVVAGLAGGLYGDWHLISDDADDFRRGMRGFLAGHVAYIAALWWAQRNLGQWEPLWMELSVAAALAALGAIVYLYLQRSLGPWRIPIVVYGTVLLLMAHRAVMGAGTSTGLLSQPALALGGALLFVVSDLMLGIERFVIGDRTTGGVVSVLVSYYAAQAMFALSAWHM